MDAATGAIAFCESLRPSLKSTLWNGADRRSRSKYRLARSNGAKARTGKTSRFSTWQKSASRMSVRIRRSIRKLPAALDCWPRKCPRKIGLRSIGLMTRRKQNKSYDAAHTKAVQQSAFVAASPKIDPPNCLRWTAMETSRRWIRPASAASGGAGQKNKYSDLGVVLLNK